MSMMTRTVALADDAYDALARLKKPGQSFSQVVRELVRAKRPRLREVLPSEPTPEEDAYWRRFQEERRRARRATAGRVQLEE
jgi:predicted CopG family antitoxin